MKIKTIIFLILFQLILVIFLSFKIFKKINSKKVSMSYIDKYSIDTKESRSFKYFYELKPNIIQTVKLDFFENKVIYNFNKDGLNERFNYPIAKSKDGFRIITLGDSFTFGMYNNTEDNWTELLENKLNDLNCKKYSKFEVINLGVHGYDIDYSVERYRIRGKKYDPDLLIWMLVDNQRINEIIQPILAECKNTFKEIVGTFSCRHYLQEELEKNMGKASIQTILSQNFNKIFDFYFKNIVAIDLNKSHQEIFKNISTPNQVNIFDYNFIDKKYKLLDGHPNQAGHQKIAEDVFDYLIKNKIIPCN